MQYGDGLPSDQRQALLELVEGIYEHLSRSDHAVAALRAAFLRGDLAASMRKVVLSGLATSVKGAVRLDLLASRLPRLDAGVAGALGVLHALQETRITLFEEVANELRHCDELEMEPFEDLLVADKRRRAELELLLDRLQLPAGSLDRGARDDDHDRGKGSGQGPA